MNNLAEKRLIDANALFRQVSKNLGSSTMYLPIDFQEEIMDAPTVDAIPISWLQKKYEENEPSDDWDKEFDRYLWDAIAYILSIWKEEQEANNDRS